MSANLDSIAAASEKVQVALEIDAPVIAGEVESVVGLVRVGGEGGRVELVPPPVAGAHMPTGDDDLPRLAGVGTTTILAADSHVQSRWRATHRQNSGNRAGTMVHHVLRDDACFGRGEMIDEHAAFARVLSEQLDVAAEHGLASEVDRPQVRELAPGREAAEELPKDRRNRVEDRNLLAIEPVGQQRYAVATHVVSDKGCAVQHAAEDVHVR